MWLFVNNHPCFGYIQITTLNNKNTQATPQVQKQRVRFSKFISEEKQQLVEKVLCKSFIQWFWELNFVLISTESYCFDSFRLRVFFNFVAVEVRWSESLEI